jgi:endonuclease YncB( thermonuclease family)
MIQRVLSPPRGALLFPVALILIGCLADEAPARDTRARSQGRSATQAREQPRPHDGRVPVDPARIEVDDGDTVTIRWAKGDREIIRILGIDTPETRHVDHGIPYAQSWGPEARAFAQGAFSTATRVELLRSATLDPFERTLGYLFIDGHNYSVLAIEARLALESVSHFGDNGLPKEAAEVLAAAEKAGPMPFEPPHFFRRRMASVSRWMKQNGVYPEK